MKIKSIIDLVSKKGIIEIRQMIENDWKVEIPFFYQLTEIDSKFFDKYLVTKKDFGFEKVIDLSSHISDNDR